MFGPGGADEAAPALPDLTQVGPVAARRTQPQQARPLLAGRMVWNVSSTFIIERSRQLSTIHRRASGFRPYPARRQLTHARRDATAGRAGCVNQTMEAWIASLEFSRAKG